MSFAFMPLYTGDYRRDTQHLSMLEHGCFSLLLMHCWDSRGPAPLDERRLFAICNARSNEEMGAVRNVLQEFFIKMDDGWYNKRMQREIERAHAISGVRAHAGKLGYQAKAKHLLSKSQASVQQVPLPPPPQLQLQPESKSNPLEQSSDCSTVYPPGFSEFWIAYPKKKNKDQAYKAWKVRKPNRSVLNDMLAAIARQKTSPDWTKDGGQFIPYPASWLSAGAWQDEAMAVEDADAALIAMLNADPRSKDWK